MIERHKQTREAPKNQRPPHGRGWSRRRDDSPGNATVWRIWRPIAGGNVLQTRVTVTDLDIALSGRVLAAMHLREARRELHKV